MSAYLGIDVGGTGSRWAIADADGSPIARGAAEGATGHLFSDGPRAQFVKVVSEIASQAAGHGIEGIVAGVTGLGIPMHGLAKEILGGTLHVPAGAIRVMDDIELAYRILFRPGQGHLISAGTGSIGMHVTADGTVVRVGGRGLLIDDAGSGVWIALRALDLVYRDIDLHGSARETRVLAEALFGMVGGSDWDRVRAYVYGNDRGKIGTLAQAVAAAAIKDDATARKIFAEAGRELARLAEALVARCGAAPAAVIGRTPQLCEILRDNLISALPGVAVSFTSVDQALGAARMAAGVPHTKSAVQPGVQA